jgi:adenylate cyclase
VIQAKGAVERKWRKTALALGAVLAIVIAAAVAWNFLLRPAPRLKEVASIERMAFPLPDKPSIAVLPFVNMSGDPQQEYIADGISENIIAALSKIPDLFVIARNSTFYYKGKPLKVQQVAEELGVRHVLEGSIQRSGDRIRITAQLVDAIKGHHLWSEKYDRDMRDLFDLLDEITKEVVVALEVKLTMGEQALTRHTTENLEAWGYATRAYSIFERISKEDNAKARELFKKAIELDPNYVFAWRFLGSTHFVDRQYGWTESRSESWKRYVECIEKALTLDPNDPEVNVVKGQIHLYQRQYDEAIARAEKAIALGPNNAAVYAHAGWYFLLVGRFEEAVLAIQKATRLQPHYPWWYKSFLALTYFQLRRYEDMLAVGNELLERSREGSRSLATWALVYIAGSYIGLGREEEARAYAKEALAVNPKLSLEVPRRYLLFKDPDHLERWLDCLRKVGIPEKPPLAEK